MHFACSTEFIPLIAAPLKKGSRKPPSRRLLSVREPDGRSTSKPSGNSVFWVLSVLRFLIHSHHEDFNCCIAFS